MPSIEQLSEAYLNDVRVMYENDMVQKDLVASGKTKGMLKVVTRPDGGELIGPNHMYYLKYGRGPGKFPPPPAMVQAIENRGIQPGDGMSIEQLAFLWGRKIATFGTDIYMGKKKGLDITQPLKVRTEKLFRDIGKEMVALIANRLRKRR